VVAELPITERMVESEEDDDDDESRGMWTEVMIMCGIL
jgi:hypothetical protein